MPPGLQARLRGPVLLCQVRSVSQCRSIPSAGLMNLSCLTFKDLSLCMAFCEFTVRPVFRILKIPVQRRYFLFYTPDVKVNHPIPINSPFKFVISSLYCSNSSTLSSPFHCFILSIYSKLLSRASSTPFSKSLSKDYGFCYQPDRCPRIHASFSDIVILPAVRSGHRAP